MNIFEYKVDTPKQNFYNITALVREAVAKSGVADGIAVVFCPHTTAGITINENADPDVVRDLLFALDKTFPDRPEFQHAERRSLPVANVLRARLTLKQAPSVRV